MKKIINPSAMKASTAAQLARDLAVFDAMCAARPLTPPPMRLLPSVLSAGQLELRSARRMGVAA